MTATVPASDVLDALDFDPELPCEHRRHARWHVPGDPAAWVARHRCPGCGGGRTYLLCDSGLEHFVVTGETLCPYCGHEGPWRDAVVILGPVRSP